jgi:3'5'-cyclic nucleotide phosphodiesterase
LAERYHGKSVAEQNSIDLAWNLFMQEDYKELRYTICSTKAEFLRFRQLVVNSVLATDIMDQELKNIRNARWMKAFVEPVETTHGEVTVAVTAETTNDVVEKQTSVNMISIRNVLLQQSQVQESIRDQNNRKATIVIEHMIQASDVSHTMQHWHIYRKWNERYFVECYNAYLNGRTSSDPSIAWYEGELGFYDFYIIPLAKKLKECGVFGVSSYEYLQYAMNNRAEWANRGKEIVAEMKERVVDSGGGVHHS